MASIKSLLELQIDAIKRMLNFNMAINQKTISEPQWKILVYDKFGQDIISPLLTVKDLRELGVTLHLLLDSDREPLQDVPAIYFVMPTEENIQKICRDFNLELYESYYLNFISAISRQKLEDIALGAIQANAIAHVSKVYDQYLNFITLEDDLFCLDVNASRSISFYEMNKGNMKDNEMELIINCLVDSLFSIIVTIGSLPIIRCAAGNAAEMISRKLDKKLRENLRDSRNSLFVGDSSQVNHFSFQRPLLLILDRNIDLATMLHHTWTFQALVHDVLDLSLNRVEILESDNPKQNSKNYRKKVEYNLGYTNKFWQTHKGSPFPVVAEAVQDELEAYKSKEDEIRKLKSAMGIEEDEPSSGVMDGTSKLTSAISSLPDLLEKKRFIDMHMNIATAVLDHIKSRKLDIYFETEEKLMGKLTLDKALTDILTDPEAGKCSDKLRLIIIGLICSNLTDQEVEQYCTLLTASGCELYSVNYIKRWRTIYSKTSSMNSYGGSGTKTENMFTKLMSQASQFAMDGVKNLVVKKHKLPVTRIVDNLMDSRQDDDFLYFDPKLLRSSESTNKMRQQFQEAIVFLVGGGNYIEYQNLLDYLKSKTTSTPRHITYGCSQLVNATQFLEQLERLGQEMD